MKHNFENYVIKVIYVEFHYTIFCPKYLFPNKLKISSNNNSQAGYMTIHKL